VTTAAVTRLAGEWPARVRECFVALPS